LSLKIDCMSLGKSLLQGNQIPVFFSPFLISSHSQFNIEQSLKFPIIIP
jgi:hypothetical protein